MNLEVVFWIVLFSIAGYYAVIVIANSSDSKIEEKDIDTEIENDVEEKEYDNEFQGYSVAWIFANLSVVVGWVALIVGIISAFIGMSQVGNSAYGNSFLIQLTAMLPGLGVALSGLLFIVVGQISRATIDAADNTKEILKIMKNNET